MFTPQITPTQLENLTANFRVSDFNNVEIFEAWCIAIQAAVNAGGGGGITLQTNGVNNISQSILNLINGAGLTLTDNGDGSVTLDSLFRSGVDANTILNSGAMITDRGSSGNNPITSYSSSVITITSNNINLKNVDTSGLGDYLINMPTNTRFYLDRVELINTRNNGGFTLQPSFQVGITGELQKFIPETQAIGLDNIFDRVIHDGLLFDGGVTSLTFGIPVAATGASHLEGRFIFTGKLIKI